MMLLCNCRVSLLSCVCTAQCPVLDDLANGRIEYSPDTEPGFDVGTNATHICNDGFVLNGNEVRECLETGEWSEEPPTCERKMVIHITVLATASCSNIQNY